jgi:hypothetical protein
MIKYLPILVAIVVTSRVRDERHLSSIRHAEHPQSMAV